MKLNLIKRVGGMLFILFAAKGLSLGAAAPRLEDFEVTSRGYSQCGSKPIVEYNQVAKELKLIYPEFETINSNTICVVQVRFPFTNSESDQSTKWSYRMTPIAIVAKVDASDNTNREPFVPRDYQAVLRYSANGRNGLSNFNLQPTPRATYDGFLDLRTSFNSQFYETTAWSDCVSTGVIDAQLSMRFRDTQEIRNARRMGNEDRIAKTIFSEQSYRIEWNQCNEGPRVNSVTSDSDCINWNAGYRSLSQEIFDNGSRVGMLDFTFLNFDSDSWKGPSSYSCQAQLKIKHSPDWTFAIAGIVSGKSGILETFNSNPIIQTLKVRADIGSLPYYLGVEFEANMNFFPIADPINPRSTVQSVIFGPQRFTPSVLSYAPCDGSSESEINIDLEDHIERDSGRALMNSMESFGGLKLFWRQCVRGSN